MSPRMCLFLAGVFALVAGVRLPAAPLETPGRGYWFLFILGGVAALALWWVTLPGRRGRTPGSGRVVSTLRSGVSAMSPAGASSAARVARMQEKSRRNEGLASGWSVLRHASGWSLIMRAKVLRPSLAGRWFVRARWVGTPLARVGRFLRVWSPCEDVTLRVGGPRMGKSGELACRILDAPGAVVATSTRLDLYNICGPVLRAERAVRRLTPGGLGVAAMVAAPLWAVDLPWWAVVGVPVLLVVPLSMWLSPRTGQARPVFVFNPAGTGGLASTVAFNPLTGCEVPKNAIERAGDLLQGANLGDTSAGDREFWIGQARRALAALMHAAALRGGSMRHVQEWLADPETHGPTVERYLAGSPSRALEQDAKQFFNTNDRTQSSIITTAMPALAWLADEAAAASAEPVDATTPVDVERIPAGQGSGRIELDIAWMLEHRAAVFMIGAEEAQTAPLLTALTAHIAREARRIAAVQPGGRLDPALTLALDEAALICTPPLDRWTADMGGLGATIHIGVQSFAQLEGKYGPAGAATILNNTGTVMVFGGTRSPADLNIYATLVGEREVAAPQWDEHGARRGFGTRMEPVLPKSQIAGLPKLRALIFKSGMLPMVGRVQMAWKRPDVRAVKRAARWESQLNTVDALELRARGRLVLVLEPAAARLARVRAEVQRRLAERRARREVEARQDRARDRGL